MALGGEEVNDQSPHDHVREISTGKAGSKSEKDGVHHEKEANTKLNQPIKDDPTITPPVDSVGSSVSEAAGVSQKDKSRLLSNMTQKTITDASSTDDRNVSEGGEATSIVPAVNTGNDRVSLDKPKLPLVASTKETSVSAPLINASTISNSLINNNTATNEKMADVSCEQPAVAKRTVSFSNNVATHVVQQVSSNGTMNGSRTDQSPSDVKQNESSSKHTMTRSSHPTQSTVGLPTMQSADKINSQPSTVTSIHHEQPSIDETVQRLRAPLVDTYDPYIEPLDTSLSSARERLRIALDQTRQLRAAFSDRVYEKYRVLLKPVPTSVDVIVDRIKSDPKAISFKLQEEMRVHKQEKEIERKEQSKIQAALAASSAADGGTASGSGVESAEQLAYIGAGLSLVILPEEDIGDHDIDLTKFPHRGPINPETGSRVGGISAAAAAAAEVLLDRVRRSTAMRMERQRRRQLQLLSGEVDVESEADNSHVFSHLHLLSSSGMGRTDLGGSVQGSSIATPGGIKRQGGARGSSAFNPSPPSKASRARTGSAMSGSSLLSLNPNAEELSSTGRPSTAASAALIAKGVGVSASNKAIQQRWRHPCPTSLGARRAALATSSSNKKGEMALLTAAGLPTSAISLSGHLALCLPLPLTPSERKNKKPVTVVDYNVASSERARNAVELVLDQFYADDEDLTPSKVAREKKPLENDVGTEVKDARVDTKSTNHTIVDSKVIQQGSSHKSDEYPPKQSDGRDDVGCTRRRRKKRRITEIGLLRGMHLVGADEGKITDEVAQNARPSQQETSKESFSGNRPIDPNLAFSVLHAIGIVHEVPKASPTQDERFMSRLHRSQENTPLECNISSTDNTTISQRETTISQIISKKRLFSQIFSRKIPQNMEFNSDLQPPNGGIVKPNATIDLENPRDDGKHPTATNCSNVAEDSNADLSAKEKISSSEAKSSESQGQSDPAKVAQLVEDDQECIVESIRGGGEVLEPEGGEKKNNSDPMPGANSVDDTENLGSKPSKSKEAKPSSPKRGGSDESNLVVEQKTSQVVPSGVNTTASSAPVEMTSTLQQPHNTWNERMALLNARQHNFSPSRNNSSRRQGQQHNGPVQHMPHAMPNPRDPYHHHQQLQLAHRDLSDYFSGMHHASQTGGFVPTQQEWSSLNAAAAGLLPATSSLAALGLSSHRAALVQMASRERAARALLAREQAHVAAAHRQQQQLAAAAAARGGAVTLSSQQAAVLMSSGHGGANFYQQGARYAHLGAHSATPIMSSSAASSALMMNAQPPQPSTSPNPRPPESRSKQPNSAGRSPGRNRSRSSSVDDKEAKKKGAIKEVDAAAQSLQSDAEMSKSPLLSGVSASTGNNQRSGPPKNVLPAQIPLVSKTQSGQENRGKDKNNDTKLPLNDKEAPDGLATSETSGAASQQAGSVSNKLPAGSISSTTNASSVPEDMAAANATGMKFLVPSAPLSLDSELAKLVVDGKIHLAGERLKEKQTKKQLEGSAALIEYLHLVAAAVPIPKTLVSNPLKDRLNTPAFKSPTGGSMVVPREVVVSVILVWLWVQYRECFRQAFAKSGRFDVDLECKWLIQSAVDSSARGLVLEIADAVARGAPLAIALGGNRNKACGGASSTPNDSDKHSPSSSKLDVQIAMIVSQALMTELCIDDEIDVSLPHFEELVDHLDICRLSALRAKCQERSLLAALISRRATMSEPFSHAYVSSMVRAGEALGHNELFEIVQDESVMSSTMIPYDFFSDETGAWEDPCRETNGFTPDLTGEELTRRAHARAMIQKSLKKLQQKHNIKGGTPHAGPYADPKPSTEESGGSPATETSTAKPGRPALNRSNSSFRRRGSSFNISDTSVPAGTGSGTATGMSLYNPNHYSSPLIWDTDDLENMPYGRFSTGVKKRSLSQSRLSFTENKRQRVSRNNSTSSPQTSSKKQEGGDIVGIRRSTEEIEWADVASIFQDVSLAGSNTPTARRASSHGHHSTPVPAGTTIVAPFCRKVEPRLLEEDDNEEYSSDEEDLSDAAVLTRHNLVLERMKTRLEKFMEIRQKAQQRAQKKKSQKPS